MAETMRTCLLLRAGLSETSGSSNFVLGNPKACHGTAYHEVLEKIVAIDLGREPIEDAVERLWEQAITTQQQQRAAAHALDHRFGSSASWPGYRVARARVLLRAKGLAVGATPDKVAAAKAGGAQLTGTIREQEFTAFNGRLVGRPDVIRAGEVVDYKSGAILEDDATAQIEVVKAANVSQPRIYGYQVKQKLDWWSKRGVLLPLGEAGVEVALDSSDCEWEANEAVGLLDSYEEKCRAAAKPEDLVSPAPNACRWCPFKLVCPSLWLASTPDWSEQPDSASIEGAVLEQPAVIYGGAARAVAAEIQAGSETLRRIQIAPLKPTTHPAVTMLVARDCVRFVGLRARDDGVLAHTQRTVLTRVADIPTVTVGMTT